MKTYMHYIKSKIRDWVSTNYFPFVFYAILMVLFHFMIEMDFADDVWFAQVMEESASFQTWIDFLISRYQGWSSRLVIEGVLIIIVRSQILWRILDTAVMVWVAVALSIFFNREGRKSVNWFIVCAMLSFPMETMSTAGWIATTLNYSWPLAFGFLAMIPIKNLVCGQNNRWYTYVLAIPALFYAVSQEQMCAVMLAICGYFTVYLFVKSKKVPWFVFSETLVSVAGLIFILTCPGNGVRTESEILTWFPSYGELSFLRKVELGYSSSLYELIMQPNLIFTLFCVVIMVTTFLYNKKKIYRCISTIPFVTSLVMGLFAESFASVFPYLSNLRNQMTSVGTGIIFGFIETWIPDLFITAIAFCILISLWGIFEDKRKVIFPSYLLLLGLATHWVMGFSPTIWASGSRTCIFMYFAIISVSVLLFSKVCDKLSNNKYAFGFMQGYIGLHIIFLVEKCLFYIATL